MRELGDVTGEFGTVLDGISEREGEAGDAVAVVLQHQVEDVSKLMDADGVDEETILGVVEIDIGAGVHRAEGIVVVGSGKRTRLLIDV